MSIKTEDLATAEKVGFFTGRYAVNPFNGEKLPIWVGNFVLLEYGTGAIMAVPAHDERDFEFCTKYQLPIRTVVVVQGAADPAAAPPAEPFSEYGFSVNSGEFSGLTTEVAKQKMAALAEYKGFGKKETIFRLKDWGISRQRYWGTPIPVIYCDKDGIVPVPDKVARSPAQPESYRRGASPPATTPEFVSTTCPKWRPRSPGPTPWTHSSIRPGISIATVIHTINAPSIPPKLPTGFDQYIGGASRHPAPALFALLVQVHARSRLNQHSEPAAAFHPGNGAKGGVAMSN
jgi:leucyl-tRNA synthetase